MRALRSLVANHCSSTAAYPEDDPLILEREHLANHMKRYASAFNLNTLWSTTVEATSFNKITKVWTVKLRTPFGPKTVKARHLVQASGLAGAEAYVPEIPGKEKYKGVNLHSAHYKNPQVLKDKGVKVSTSSHTLGFGSPLSSQGLFLADTHVLNQTVMVVGSANSAFDVMEDCAAGGLQTTMNARSPTYIFPWDYALAPQGMGQYIKEGPAVADKIQMSSPNGVVGQLIIKSYTAMAAKEPDRFAPLAATGFPVYDSSGGKGDLFSHLLERGGGHFNDIGHGIEFIVSGKVAVKGSVEPVAYTETGLAFSDGSTVEADAIVWCTGFKDTSREVTAKVLGGKRFDEAAAGAEAEAVIGPHDIAAQRDAVWGVDREGELRGVFKRHLRVDNFWVFGGTTAMHRYYSLPMAAQIKAELGGFLPEAYRDHMPEV